MTSVIIDRRVLTDGGTAGAAGWVSLRPSRSFVAGDLDGDPRIEDKAFTVELVDGVASVNLLDTDGTWCWVMQRTTSAGEAVGDPVGFLVPTSASPLNFEALTFVDPDTLTATSVPAAAWWAEIAALDVRVTTLEGGGGGGGWSPVDASTTVKGIVELATDAEAQAGTDTTRAVTPAALAAVVGTLGSLNGLGAAIWSSSTGWPARPTCTVCFWIGTQSASAGYPSEATDYDVVFQHPDAP